MAMWWIMEDASTHMHENVLNARKMDIYSNLDSAQDWGFWDGKSSTMK